MKKFPATRFDFHFLLGGSTAVLFLSFVTSNHFLILNEETVVAICFIAFIIFSFQVIGKPEALDERTTAIKTELNQALTLEKKYCEQVMYELENPKTGAFISMAKSLLSAKLAWYVQKRVSGGPAPAYTRDATYNNMETTFQTLIGAKLDNRIVVSCPTATQKMFEEKWLDLVATEFEASCTFDVPLEEVLCFVPLKEQLSFVEWLSLQK